MSEPRKEFLCPECDWIGSPEIEPDVCPNCGNPNLEELDISDVEDEA